MDGEPRDVIGLRRVRAEQDARAGLMQRLHHCAVQPRDTLWVIPAPVRVGIRRHLIEERCQQFPGGRNVDHARLVIQALNPVGRFLALGILAKRHNVPDTRLTSSEGIRIQLIIRDDELRCIRVNVAAHVFDGILPARQGAVQADGDGHMPDDGHVMLAPRFEDGLIDFRRKVVIDLDEVVSLRLLPGD